MKNVYSKPLVWNLLVDLGHGHLLVDQVNGSLELALLPCYLNQICVMHGPDQIELSIYCFIAFNNYDNEVINQSSLAIKIGLILYLQHKLSKRFNEKY